MKGSRITGAGARRQLPPFALGLLAGLLICASLPPWGWWPLAPVGIALWLHILAGRSRRARFALGWAVGAAWFAASTLWIAGLTPPGYLFGVIVVWGPLIGIVSAVAPADRRRLLVVPAGVVLFEWLHTHAPFGGVPLSMLSMGQTRAPLLPAAVLGGGLLVSGLVAALGAAIYVAVAERRWQVPVAIVAGCAVFVGAGALWPQGDPVGTVRIAAVQGGGPQGTRYTADEAPRVYQRHLETTRSITGDVDLVLWPENAINISGTFAGSGWESELIAEAKRLDAPILVGVVEDAPGDPDRFVNFVVVIGPDGVIEDRYDKERRVPYGEYVPLRFLLEPIAGDTLPPRDQIPGEGSARLETRAGPMAVAISWEIFFPRRVREGVRDGGEIVLNPTNGSSYWLTQVQTQQIATSSLRAVESGRWVIQAAPTGFTAVIDAEGSVRSRTSISERAVVTAEVPRLTTTTPAQALGDVPALALAFAALAITLGWSRRRRSLAADEPPQRGIET